MHLKYFKFLPIKESCVLFVGDIMTKMLNFLNYNKYVKLRKDVNKLNQNGIHSWYKNQSIKAKFIEKSNAEMEVFLRPYTSDNLVFQQVLIRKEYLPICDMVNTYNLSSDIKFIVDAGANIGLTSLYFSCYYKEAFIVAIEPDIDNYKMLVKNIDNNKLDGKIKPLQNALWFNNTDILSITNSFRDGGSWSKSVAINENGAKKNSLEPITLQDIVAQNASFDYIDLLKIDIEGAECVLFKSEVFKELLFKRVLFLCMEIHEEMNCKNEILEFLKVNKFEIKFEQQTFFCINKLLIDNLG